MLAQEFISESCSWFHTQDNTAQAIIMEGLSGIGLDRLGSYSECTKDAALRYFLFEYKLAQGDETYFTGICYSSNCTASDLMFITKSMNDYLHLPFRDYKFFQPYTTSYFWNPFTIILLTILLITLLPTIFSSLATLLPKNKKKIIPSKLLEVLSLQSSINFLFQKSSNNQRIKVLAGLRAFAFLGMTLFNMTMALSQIPTNPQHPQIQTHVVQFYYLFDLWLAISGFYFAFELSKHWSKGQSIKYVAFTFIRKTIKIVIVSMICVLWINSMVRSVEVNPLWSLTLDFLSNSCSLINFFGNCTYGMWIWFIEVLMCFLMAFYFVLWHWKIRYNKIVILLFNAVCLCGFFLIAFLVGPEINSKDIWSFSFQSPLVTGISYVMGFNFGLLYFSFRVNRNKQNTLIIKIFRFRIVRILIFMISIGVIVAVYLYFIFFASKVQDRSNVINLFLFHILITLSYFILVIGELVGFENAFGAFLKDHFMGLLSKLSFSSYTLFYGVTLMIINSRKQDLYINTAKVLGLWVCSLAVSVGIGFMLCVFVEIPLYRALHTLFGRTSPRGFIQFY